MSFANPLALLLLLPAAALIIWLAIVRGRGMTRLPGHWHRTIDAAMRPLMVQQVVSQTRLPLVFWLLVWTLLVLGLSRPVLDSGAPAAYGNLAGRVIAIDLGAGIDIERQRQLTYRIMDAAPMTPTALVVATAEAFGVVPLTTDHGQLDRYLQAIDNDVMPVAGRAPGIAIVHAESILERAGVVVGQGVLLTGGSVPQVTTESHGDWLRALVVEGHTAGWQNYADRIGARLADEETIAAIVDDLDDEVADAMRASDRTGDFALSPWLIAAGALLWLAFFRRVRSS